ncbi:MAG TPA: hypothetical protein DEP65_02645 [Ruminococcus sp.]|nr:hypothetical protein [Ruminococcus sp.]
MSNKDIYKAIKDTMAKQRDSVKGFTYKFFEKFLAAKQLHIENLKNNIDDSYYSGHVLLFHCYDDIYQDKFYTDNSGAYCLFLQLLSDYI